MGNCQDPCDVDLSLPAQPAAGALWNSAIGRRTFLKRTGGATLATALALHGSNVQVLAADTAQMAILWELISWGTPTPINVGPFPSAAAAEAAIHTAMRQAVAQTNVTQTSGMVDVTGRVRKTRIWSSDGNGGTVANPPAITPGPGGWSGSVTIPSGTIFVMYYSGASGESNAPV